MDTHVSTPHALWHPSSMVVLIAEQHHGTVKTLGSRRRPWDERAQFFDSVVIYPKGLGENTSICASAVARVKLLRGFWARGRVRGDRSVFVTSHRPVHSSRALMFSAWFELLHFRTGAIFLV